jgi:hypothetical protein
MTSNIPRNAERFLLYNGGLVAYGGKSAEVAAHDDEGFLLSRKAEVRCA